MASESQKLQDLPLTTGFPKLAILDPKEPHAFIKPVKRITEGHDVPRFLTSKAYADIATFVMQLNRAMCPRGSSTTGKIQTWQIDKYVDLPEPVKQLQQVLQSVDAIIDEAPPDTGPRRFGNVSFRKWFEILESRVDGLLQNHLPLDALGFRTGAEEGVTVQDELVPYLLGSFGSPQRLDYGTGHELSFLAFLGCLWKVGVFRKEPAQDGALERGLVLGVIEPYLRVVRRLILTYTLEPAGSHGVWGLDDHFFLSYIFGSSQYSSAITENDPMPIDGSLRGAPNPGDIAKKAVVDDERQHNMYFSAVGFINDVKTGPFWEHSPILFDISGVRSGWGKINKGMLKMYNAEVLSKFPVVQHFPFGSLFSWETDPSAKPTPNSTHISNLPLSYSSAPTRPPRGDGMSQMPATGAPWASSSTTGQGANGTTTRAPWLNSDQANQQNQSREQQSSQHAVQGAQFDVVTKAPWAK